MAAVIEALATEDCIRWPGLLAPYQVCLISPKKGSKEEAASELTGHLYDHITEAVPQLRGEVLLDDRTHLTIGYRLKDANKFGYPFVIDPLRGRSRDPSSPPPLRTEPSRVLKAVQAALTVRVLLTVALVVALHLHVLQKGLHLLLVLEVHHARHRSRSPSQITQPLCPWPRRPPARLTVT